ncbi:MAG: phospholipid carrier-dependent glycosyltransferase [Gemmatimonadota bacterium]
MRSRGRDLLLLFLLALVLGLTFEGSRGLYETTEGRYAEVGREMLETGNWWVPQLDYRSHWSKPPLTYWGVAAGIAVAGPTALGARLVNALAFPFLVLTVAWLGGLLWDGRTGALAGLVYATSLFPVVAASTVSTDLVLTLWETLGAALYWKALRVASRPTASSGRGGRRPGGGRWIVAFWSVMGLAFLTKGPPGLLTLLVVLVFHGLALRRGWRVPRLGSLPGLLVFLVVGFGWYLDVVLRTPGLLDYFLRQEVVERIATDRFHRNPEWYKPPLVYGPPLVLGLGGWLFHARSVRRGLRARGVVGSLRRRLGAGPIRLFLSLWLLLPLGVLTLSRSRLPLYVLPFFAVLPLVFARAWTGDRGGPRHRTRAAWTAAVTVVALLGLKAASARVRSSKDMAALRDAVTALASGDSTSGPARVVAVDQGALYGLEYYLGGALERASTETPPSDPISLSSYLGDAPGSSGASRYVFVGRGDGAERARRRVCADPRFACRGERREEGWRLWLATGT